MPAPPPPLPGPHKNRSPWKTRALAGGVVVAGILGTLFTLGVYSGLIRALTMTGSRSMVPTLSPGDHLFMEGVSHQVWSLRRGDVIAFKTDSIREHEREIWPCRVVGVPGDRLQLRDGTLYVNDTPAVIMNRNGVIHYSSRPVHTHLRPEHEPIAVPEGAYFVLGDNSELSFDSRFWGFLPLQDVLGRIWFSYWPPRSVGWIQ